MMTKRDFELVARLLKDTSMYLETKQKEVLVDEFVKAFTLEFERFNSDKFIDACYKNEN